MQVYSKEYVVKCLIQRQGVDKSRQTYRRYSRNRAISPQLLFFFRRRNLTTPLKIPVLEKRRQRCRKSSNMSNSLDVHQEALFPGMFNAYEMLCPIVDQRRIELLEGLINSTAVNLSDGVRAIRTGNHARFLDSDMMASDTIYERHFYPQLVSTIRCAKRRVLLMSNPGTGKSVFQFYLLARYLNPSLFIESQLTGPIKFGSDVLPKVIIRQVQGTGVEVWFLEQHLVHFIDTTKIATLLRCFDPAITLYFFDPAKTKGIEPFADESGTDMSTLATMSPDISRYKEYKKIARTVYMPVFTEKELLAIGKDMRISIGFPQVMEVLYSEGSIRSRYAMYNGIIRHVLPQDDLVVAEAKSDREFAFENISAASFLNGNLERQTISSYLAVYDVAVDQGGYNFTKYHLCPVNLEVAVELQKRVKKISLDDRILALQSYGETGNNKFGSIPSIYESVIADHLTSLDGVRWKQRNCSVAGAKASLPLGRKRKADEPIEGIESTITYQPLVVKGLRLGSGLVPPYSEMEMNVLYRSTNVNFPLCDLVFKNSIGKIVCIQVSMESGGKRDVTLGAFKDFTSRMGWAMPLTQDKLSLVSYVYCPDPAFANVARVKFEDGICIDNYCVWCIDKDYTSSVSY